MKIHFIGIGGIGVSALARYYIEKGAKVSGSDLVLSEITEALEKLGAKVFIGHHATRNVLAIIDLVIYSPAVQTDNPELKEAKRRKIKCQSYPEALGGLTKKYFTIAVCGSHGKSTVAAMIGILLTRAGFDPTVIVGTKVKEFGDSNCRMGKSPEGNPPYTIASSELRGKSASYGARKYLVIEADEHMASFLNYWPKIIVLTAIESDHLDYYKNLNNIIKTFRKYIGHLPEDGVLVANGDDKNIQRILNPKSEIRNPKLPPLAESSTKSGQILNSKFQILSYSLEQPEAKKLREILKIPGEFNISNALAALTAARALKISDKISFQALSEYKGSWRRFEIKKIKCNEERPRCITLISDYAHHPTQIKATLEAAREKFPKKKIWCIFQPHQYQRTYYLFDDFVKVLSAAPVNKLIITDIYDVAGRESSEMKRKVSSEKLVSAVKNKFEHKMSTVAGNLCQVEYFPFGKIKSYLKENLKGGEVVFIMGAGDIYEITRSY